MMHLWLVVTFALVSVAASVLGISASLADPCAALRSQLAPSGRSGGISSELAQLRRQLAATQGLERQRRCTAQSAVGGFFNACADLAKSRTQVQRQIAGAAISRRDASGLQARLVALGCTPAAGQQRQRPAGAMIGSNSMLFCVRLSDGYFFPAPKSQFVQGGDVKEMVDQCRYICDDAGVDLYTLRDPSLETEKMVALDTRTSYKDLPTAFKYRNDANFRACDLNALSPARCRAESAHGHASQYGQRDHSFAVSEAGSWHRGANSPAWRRRCRGQGRRPATVGRAIGRLAAGQGGRAGFLPGGVTCA
ncbi:DUF2865 domain-containing protein [Mesorhizobium sp. L103C119B0]|uniref:DUF2865 domain-containing protein n=1 Tax=Mesorhizobium sp. L103C119B0 TaxID=1287085 RepID=UPI001FDA7553|nr:DUF2865 domain-containing protein [Mesorhizobium sp. L103C119B0]